MTSASADLSSPLLSAAVRDLEKVKISQRIARRLSARENYKPLQKLWEKVFLDDGYQRGEGEKESCLRINCWRRRYRRQRLSFCEEVNGFIFVVLMNIQING